MSETRMEGHNAVMPDAEYRQLLAIASVHMRQTLALPRLRRFMYYFERIWKFPRSSLGLLVPTLSHRLCAIMPSVMFDQDGSSQSNTGEAHLFRSAQDVYGAGKAKQRPSLDLAPSCEG